MPYKISDFDASERPRERLAHYGPQALSNAELLAILLRTGLQGENVIEMSRRLLKELGGLPGLHRASYEEVCVQKGIGPAKAAQLKAAIELGRRLSIEAPNERIAIHSPADAANLLLYEMGALEQEELRVLLLDIRNCLLGSVMQYKGSTSSAQVRVGEVFRDAIRRNAQSILVAHNHPSGDPTPSPDDVAITRALVQAGKMLDIEVLDHLVIGSGRWISLKERGLGF